MNRSVMLLVIWLAFVIVSPVAAQSEPIGQTRHEATLYATPYPDNQPVATLAANTLVVLVGRTDSGLWVQVQAADTGTRGWIGSGSIELPDAVRLIELPVIAPDTTQFVLPLDEPSDAVMEKLTRLHNAPIFMNFDTEAVYDTFQQGQALNNRAQVFTKVGDSNSTSGDFLRPLGMRHGECQLGAYAYLQETVDYFSVSPREPYSNSFDTTNLTTVNGLTTAAALDPLWASDPACEANESLLSCEYRVVKPSVSVIMIGLMDLEYYSVDLFASNLAVIVQQSINQGVIPVLTTFPVLPDYPSAEQSLWEKNLDLNIAMLDVAEHHQTPLIHLWKAAQTLPQYGIGPDRTHLRHELGSFCAFDGAEQRVGGTLRNLLTLQALDMLRRDVLMAEMP